MAAIREVGTFGEILFLRHTFGRIVDEAVSQHNWKSAPLPAYQLIRHEPSRHTPATASCRHQARELEAVFWQSVAALDELNWQERVAQWILSLIWYGGVIEKALLCNLSGAEIVEVHRCDNLVWLNIPADRTKAVPGTIKRVFPDAISQQLLRRLRVDQRVLSGKTARGKGVHMPDGGWSERKLWEHLRVLLQKFGALGRSLPKSLTQLCKWSKTQMDMVVPPYLVDYAAGRNPSYSMSDAALRRLLTGETGGGVGLGENGSREGHTIGDRFDGVRPYRRPEGSNGARYCAEFEALERVEQAVRKVPIDGLEALVDENVSSLSPTAVCLARWYVGLRCGTVPGRLRNKGQSIQNSFVVGRELVACARGRDILQLKVSELEDLYESVLDLHVTLSGQCEAGKTLKSLHAYLMRTNEHVPAVDWEELDGFVSPRHSVNANVLSPDHYDQTLNRVWVRRDLRDRYGYMRYLITGLGYRLAGRRQEVRRLRLKDLVFLKTQAFLRMVDTALGEVKSASSRRWFPLHDLLSADELAYLRRWHAQRCAETEDRDALLFCDVGCDHELVGRERTFDIILAVLRAVTGDPSIKYHSLRHSFPTWLLLGMEANRLPDLPKEIGDVKAARFETLLDGRSATRKLLYQTSMLMGHASPRMTLLHYVHCCDLLLHYWMRRRVPRLRIEHLGPLLGYRKSSVYRKLRDRGIEALAQMYELPEALVIARPALTRDE